MLSLQPRWPNRLELLGVILVLCGMLAMAGREIQALRARPAVLDVAIDNRTEDVRRGPVKKWKKETILPDGTKTIESTTEEGPKETLKTASSEKSHSEIPPAVVYNRYIGLATSPLNYKKPRLSAGLTFSGRYDIGAYYDMSRRINDGAIGAEGRARF